MLKLSWTGDLPLLKSFIQNSVQIEGTWSSPCGEKKSFTDGVSTISWSKNKKYLTFSGERAATFKGKFCSILCPNWNRKIMVNKTTSPQKLSTSPARHSQYKCGELQTDIEGVKLDMVIYSRV